VSAGYRFSLVNAQSDIKASHEARLLVSDNLASFGGHQSLLLCFDTIVYFPLNRLKLILQKKKMVLWVEAVKFISQPQ